VSLNYNKVYGWIDFDSISPEYISKNFDAEWKKQSSKYPMDLPNMKKLYEAVDVIGLSGGHHATFNIWASAFRQVLLPDGVSWPQACTALHMCSIRGWHAAGHLLPATNLASSCHVSGKCCWH
jgi:hypothetical protein